MFIQSGIMVIAHLLVILIIQVMDGVTIIGMGIVVFMAMAVITVVAGMDACGKPFITDSIEQVTIVSCSIESNYIILLLFSLD